MNRKQILKQIKENEQRILEIRGKIRRARLLMYIAGAFLLSLTYKNPDTLITTVGIIGLAGGMYYHLK